MERIKDRLQKQIIAIFAFTDFDTIDERLGDRSIMVQEYAARSGGWVQCSIIPVERDKNGKKRQPCSCRRYAECG